MQEQNENPELNREKKIIFKKIESKKLPLFTKEVPLKTIVKKYRGYVTIEYERSFIGGEEIKIRFMKIDKNEEIAKMHKINLKDGITEGYFKLGKNIYIIRKTTKSIAERLMAVSKKLNQYVEQVIGYFITARGNTYYISKIENPAYSPNKSITPKVFSLENLRQDQKQTLFDRVVEKVIGIYKKDYLLTHLDLKSIIITGKRIVIPKPEHIVKSNSKEEKVEHFLRNMREFKKEKIADEGDITYGISLCFAHMENSVRKWAEKRGLEKEEEILDAMEKTVNEY